jgi:D-aspartate ligase
VGPLNNSTPVLILGGADNSIALTRSFGKYGVSVAVSGSSKCWGMYSRYCAQKFRVPVGSAAEEYWNELLLSEDHELDGHLLCPCSDDAILFVADHRQELLRRYILDGASADQQRAMIDKKRTLELAREVGVGAPNFWSVNSVEDIESIRDTILFPVMVKPVVSHEFVKVFGCKLFIIESDFSELKDKARMAHEHGLEVMVVEMIPGPDSLLSSYYTYMDENGDNLFHFTKRVLRRFPVNRGGACYHITEWLPETAEQGRKFFDGIKFRGLGNIEFKRDTRDGKLKIIEVNARFTGAHELVVRSGAPIDLIVYCQLTGQPVPTFREYSQFLRFWYPATDFRCYLELRKRGELDFFGWLKSVFPYRQVFPLWNIRDPLPSIAATSWRLRHLAGRSR